MNESLKTVKIITFAMIHKRIEENRNLNTRETKTKGFETKGA